MKYRETLAAAIALVVMFAALGYCSGCAWLPGDDASDAELRYRAALLRCVDKATTLAESKACRKQVDAETFGGSR
jgi:hypothetical protein